MTKGLLTHLGCDVTAVSSSEECLHIISQDHKVVFVDICTVGVDGYDIAVCIRDKFKKRLERPLIVALTGNTEKAAKENCTRVGIDGVVLKPISLDKMRQLLSELLEHRGLLK